MTFPSFEAYFCTKSCNMLSLWNSRKRNSLCQTVAGILCIVCKSEKCMLHLYRCVLGYLTLFSSSACILWRGLYFFVSLFVSLYISMSHVLWKYFYQALYFESLFFCPSIKADTGSKLVSCLLWPHNKAYWMSYNLCSGGQREEDGCCIFLVSFYAAHCSNHCLYFPIVSTEYGVHINIL